MHVARHAAKDRWKTMCTSRQRMGLKLSCVDALCVMVMNARKPSRNQESLIWWRSRKQERKRQRAIA